MSSTIRPGATAAASTVPRWLMNDPPALFHEQMGDLPDGVKVDRWQITHGEGAAAEHGSRPKPVKLLADLSVRFTSSSSPRI